MHAWWPPAADGSALALLVAQVLAQACGVDAAGMQLPLAADAPQPGGGGDEVATQALPAPEPLAELLAGRVRCVEFSGGRVFVDAPRGGRLYLPGSFNPLHDGHTALLAAALRAAPHCGEAGFELSVANADKVGGAGARGGCTTVCHALLLPHPLAALCCAGLP